MSTHPSISLAYAGIGSRKTPADVLALMRRIGERLALRGWTLRSGHAEGADQAFEAGCLAAGGRHEIFLPWPGFNGAPDAPGYVCPRFGATLMVEAARFHPAWAQCNPGVRKLHARNVCQVLGLDLDAPIAAVICWTPGAAAGGGTGHAIRIAHAYGIPVFDLGAADRRAVLAALAAHIEAVETKMQHDAPAEARNPIRPPSGTLGEPA